MSEIITSADQDNLHGQAIDHSTNPKVRAVIRRNFYEFQSEALTQAWTDCGWSTIASYPIDYLPIHAEQVVRRSADWEAVMGVSLELLLAHARRFVECTV